MTNNDVKKVLVSKNIANLYHANTVLTALTFINNGGLLSRETVENANLLQTPQETDKKDKSYGIYNDIFFDSVDIHERVKNVNHYGPVTFVYNIDVLDELSEYEICVTRTNPANWCDTEKNDCSCRYYQDIYDLETFFSKGNLGQHITVRNIDTPVNFKYLKEIIIDYPGEKHAECFNNAYQQLTKALEVHELDAELLKIRKCAESCKCRQKYKEYRPGYTYYRFRTELSD